MSTNDFYIPRFWCPKGGQFKLDAEGYLRDSTVLANMSTSPDILPDYKIAGDPCLVMLGDPGMGKSLSMKHMAQESRTKISPERILDIDLRSFSDQAFLYRNVFESHQWLTWVNETYILTVFLDSLDECLIHVKTTASMLVDEFRKYPTGRLHLRIACRTAEWPELLNEELPKIWGGEHFGIYELVPFRRVDVEAVARESRLTEISEFMQSIQDQGMVPFAIRPITLKMLIEQFKREKSLSGDQTDLYHQYIQHLCTELSISRKAAQIIGSLSPEQRVAVAERIAALTIFSQKSSVYTEDFGADKDELAISEISGGVETASGSPFPVTPEGIRETLKFPLFSEGRVWGHWTYAEFLAAQYLLKHEITYDQAADFFFHPDRIETDDQMLVPQLQETAAWFCIGQRRFLERVLKTNPQTLLRSPVILSDLDQRRALVGSVLALSGHWKMTDAEIGFRQHYKNLDHPDLTEQLKPFIIDKSKEVIPRRIATDIAGACMKQELEEDLFRVLFDRSEDFHVRVQAGHALLLIAGTEARDRFKSLLDRSEPDLEDELRGIALRALWPNSIASDELFAHLTAPKKENFFGQYAFFLTYDLAPNLRVEDLPAALGWTRQQPEDYKISFHFGKLIDRIIVRAWDHIDNGQVLKELAETAVYRLKCNHEFFSRQASKPENLSILNDTEKSRLLIQAMIPIIEEAEARTLAFSAFHSRLLKPTDFIWLTERLRASESKPEESRWAIFASTLYNSNDAAQTKAILSMKGSSAIVDKAFVRLFEPIELGSTEADQYKKEEEQSRRFQESGKGEAKHPPIRDITGKWLDKFEAGELQAFWRLCLDLTLTPDSDDYHSDKEFEPDLTLLPAWLELDGQTRGRIGDAAQVYLFSGDPSTDDWLGKNIMHRPALAGLKALYLLQKVKPEHLSKLSSAVWSKWTPAVLAYAERTSDRREFIDGLLKSAYFNAPEAFLQTLDRLISNENRENGSLSVTYKLKSIRHPQIIGLYIRKIRSDSSLKPEVIAKLLEECFEAGSPDAFDLASLRIKLDAEQGSETWEIAKNCAALLLIYSGERGWQVIKPLLDRDHPISHGIICELARHDSFGGKTLQSLNEDAIADLHIWITKRYPPAEDPQFGGAHGVGDREGIGRFRDFLLQQLREKGSPAAVQAVRRIVQAFPDDKWLNYYLIEARQVAFRKTWEGHSPGAILNLARGKEHRFVDSPEQLIEVVIDSLKRLEKLLHGETPAVSDIWNEPPERCTPKQENSISDRIKRHLEDDLKGRGIIANREPEIRRGQETDIRVDAITPSRDKISVVIEVKGCWHPDLKKGMPTQLRDRYLKESQCKLGLYLVVWCLCGKWDQSDYRKGQTPQWSLSQAREFFDVQAQDLSGQDTSLRSFVLDATLR